jgi:hypothetical protein
MTAANTTGRQTTIPESRTGRTPAQMILRWLALTLLTLLASAALVYIGDYAIFLLRGQPLDQIVVTRYMAAPLKGNKTEYYYEGTGPTSCAKALFSQNGWSPCWYLRRHPIYSEPA